MFSSPLLFHSLRYCMDVWLSLTCSDFMYTGDMNTYPSPLMKKQCDRFQQEEGPFYTTEVAPPLIPTER